VAFTFEGLSPELIRLERIEHLGHRSAPSHLLTYSLHRPTTITYLFTINSISISNSSTENGEDPQGSTYCSISFKSTVTCHAPPVDIEIWQGSRVTRPFVEPPEHHTGLKIACKTPKKPKISIRCRKFCRCHAKFWLLSKCRIGFLGHASHPVSI
jgi:hypothetical protein